MISIIPLHSQIGKQWDRNKQSRVVQESRKWLATKSSHSFAYFTTSQQRNITTTSAMTTCSFDPRYWTSTSIKSLFDMTYSVLWEFQPKSCQGIHAFRIANHHPAPFTVSLIREIVRNRENEKLLNRVLPRTAAKQAPFSITLGNLHRTYALARCSVKSQLRSNELYDFKDRLRRDLADAQVFLSWIDREIGRSLSLHRACSMNPTIYNRRLGVPIRTRIETSEETDQLLEEVAKWIRYRLEN